MTHLTTHLVGLQVPIPAIPAMGVGVLKGWENVYPDPNPSITLPETRPVDATRDRP
jgi:hypothetical protein